MIYSSLLGGGMSSRLFQEIREKRGLVYGISSFSSAYSDTGVFGIYLGTGDSQIKELIPVLCDQLNTSSDSITEKEINRGKAQLKASLLMGRESAFRRCEVAARQLIVFNRVIEPPEILKKIDEVNIETVKRIAKKIVSRPITISSIGPIENLETLDKIQARLN
jgi:predicted Zn-dependent peptidase